LSSQETSTHRCSPSTEEDLHPGQLPYFTRAIWRRQRGAGHLTCCFSREPHPDTRATKVLVDPGESRQPGRSSHSYPFRTRYRVATRPARCRLEHISEIRAQMQARTTKTFAEGRVDRVSAGHGPLAADDRQLGSRRA
jgi:hypothetical protein